MSVWDDMAHDAGYRGDEARQVAAQIEAEEREKAERREAERCEQCLACGGRGRRSSWINELGREVEGVCGDCEGTGARDWRQEVAAFGLVELGEPGAIVVRLDRLGPSAVSRPYLLKDYKDSREMRRVACTRQARLMNADTGGWNYYVVAVYPDDEWVVWTGMHSILISGGGPDD